MAAPCSHDPHETNRGSRWDRPGALAFAVWADKGLKWTDVGISKNETTIAQIMKDSDDERGKRFCVGGSVIEIQVVKSEVGKFHVGLLMTDATKLVHFIGVGSSGEIVERSYARFCGVAAGKFDYPNSAGGVGHAVELVGMFDIEANRKR